MAGSTSVDELVQSVHLYRNRKLLFHGYVLPFVLFYLCWIYFWVFIYGFWEHYEGGCVGIAVIGMAQILACLFCHWSVHVHCFFSCNTVSAPLITSKSPCRKRLFLAP